MTLSQLDIAHSKLTDAIRLTRELQIVADTPAIRNRVIPELRDIRFAAEEMAAELKTLCRKIDRL